MPRTPRIGSRPLGRPRKTPPSVRFAPVRLDDTVGARHPPAPMAAVFELVFPDGLILRVARDADPVALEQFFTRLRRRMD